MTNLEQMQNINTIEDGIKFLEDFNNGIVLEDIDICSDCEKYGMKGCYDKEVCKPKMLRKFLEQDISSNGSL